MRNIEDFYTDYGKPPLFLTTKRDEHLNRGAYRTPKGVQHIAQHNIPFKIKSEWESDVKLNVLLAHFKPFKNEFDSLDYPMFLSKIWPNSNIHLTYDKSPSTYPLSFVIKNGRVEEIDQLAPSYDIIIGRSSALTSMSSRSTTAPIVKKTKFKAQMRSMGLSQNKRGYDFVFDDNAVSPPPSPVYRENSGKILKQIKKQEIILFVGSFAGWKNQGSFVDLVDTQLCKDFSFVFLGAGTQAREVSRKCKRKNIRHYMGSINHEYMPFFTCISRLNVNNTDSRAWGQPYDPNPRVLGESAISNTHSICSKLTLFNEDLEKYVTSYDHESKTDLNQAVKDSLLLDCSGYRYNFISLEQKCFYITQTILNEFSKF